MCAIFVWQKSLTAGGQVTLTDRMGAMAESPPLGSVGNNYKQPLWIGYKDHKTAIKISRTHRRESFVVSCLDLRKEPNELFAVRQSQGSWTHPGHHRSHSPAWFSGRRHNVVDCIRTFVLRRNSVVAVRLKPESGNVYESVCQPSTTPLAVCCWITVSKSTYVKILVSYTLNSVFITALCHVVKQLSFPRGKFGTYAI